MSDSVADVLLGAVDTVVQGRLQALKYDRTIECLVVSDKQKKDGVYTVEYDGGQFTAYGSAGDRYYVNDTVYVNIPQGDFTKQKLIIGRKVIEETPTQTYTLKLPFDDFIGLQHLAPIVSDDEVGFLVNKPEDGWIEERTEDKQIIRNQNTLIWQWHTAEDNTPMVNNKLGISVDIQSLLAQYRPLRGKYGLRIEINGIGVTTDRDPAKEKTFVGMFTTDDMYGNTYAFSSPFTQQKIFDISDFMYLRDIKIYFWQDFSFVDEQNNMIPYRELMQNIDGTQSRFMDMPDNLLFSNIDVYLGLTSEDIDDERVFLYTYDDVYFGREYETAVDRSTVDTRTLQCAWVHREEDGSYTLIDTPEKLADHGAHIYWYFNKYGTEIDGSDPPQRFGGINWKYLCDEPNLTDQFTFTTQLDISKNTQKYKVIVHHDNSYDVSNILTFTNVVPVEDVQESLSAATEIVFRLLRKQAVWKEIVKNPTTGQATGEIRYHNDPYETVTRYVDPLDPKHSSTYQVIEDRSDVWEKQFTLVEDNTLSNFFVYDENNKCIKNKDEEYWCDQYYYIQIWIRNNEDSTYIPLMVGEDYDNQGFDVEWRLPDNSDVTKPKSMFTSFAEIDASDKEFASLVPGYNNMSDDNTFIAQAKKITRKFTIANYWDMTATNNTLIAVITRNGRTYNINRTFLFGQSGSTGSDYTLVISQDVPEGSTRMVADGNFVLTCRVFDQWGNDVSTKVDPVTNTTINSKLFQISWQLIGPALITKTALENVPTSPENSSWNILNEGNYLENKIAGYVRKDANGFAFPPIFRVTVKNVTTYPITAVRGFQIVDSAGTYTDYITDCPGRIEYKSDGTIPLYDTSEFVVRHSTTSDVFYPDQWSLLEYKKNNGTWEIVAEKDQCAALAMQQHNKDTTIATNYGSANLPPYKTYRLQMKDPYFWEESFGKNKYLCLEWQEGNAWVRQSITIDHNQYSSSLINAWDGTLNIDKENNAVLARMLSAGTRDANHRFTGVLLGDWKDNADSSLMTPGLYGLIKGEQSFGLKTDGTGFIGTASAGQITFDGNKALISSPDKNFYLNLNPITYNANLLNGKINLETNNAHNYSPYFLYAKTKKVANTDVNAIQVANPVTGKYDSLAQWTDSFLNDTTHDYFIVDPNNGVLTSGGIIAKYGRIGNWYVTNEGLAQRAEEGDRFMYLGYSPADDALLRANVQINNPETDSDKTILTIDEAEAKIEGYQKEYSISTLSAEEQRRQALIDALIAYKEAHPEISTGKVFTLDPQHYFNYGEAALWTAQLIQQAISEGVTNGGELRQWATHQENLEKIITSQKLTRPYHYHYTADGGKTGIFLTGGPSVYGALLGLDIGTYVPYSNLILPTSGTITRINEIPTTKMVFFQKTYYGTPTPSELLPWDGLYNAGDRVPYFYLKPISTNENIATLDYLNEYIEKLTIIYDYYYTDYHRQLAELGLAVDGLLPDSVLKPINDAYKAATKDAQAILDAKTNAMNAAKQVGIDAYNTINRYCIYAGTQAYTNPVFSVKWDGTLQARYGILGKNDPWFISDNGLTMAKNSGIIYLGNAEVLSQNDSQYDAGAPKIVAVDGDTNSVDIKWKDNNTEYNVINNGKITSTISNDSNYIIFSAGQLANSAATTINFGVTRKGFLFSQAGSIGGWTITNNTLQSVIKNNEGVITSSITLDATRNCLSFMNDSTVIFGDGTIRLGQFTDGKTTGKLYLANYLLQGTKKGGTQSITNALSLNPSADEVASYSSSTNAGYDIVKYDKTEVAAGRATPAKTSISVYTDSDFKIIDAESTSTGIAMVTGSTSNTSPGTTRTLLLYPTGCDSSVNGKATLGLPSYRWNLIGNYIECNSIMTNTLCVSDNYIYCKGEKLASEPWVSNELAKVYNAIGQVGSSAGSAIGSAKGAYGGVNNLSKVLHDIFDDKGFSIGGYVSFDGPSSIAVTYGLKTITITDPQKGGYGVAASKTSTSLDYNKVKSISLQHQHDCEVAWDDTAGKITVKIKDANFQGASSTNGDFTISSTGWFKARAYGSISISQDKYIAGTKQIKITYTIKAKDGIEELATGSKNVACDAVYTEGYSAGKTAGYQEGLADAPTAWVGTPYIQSGTGTHLGDYRAVVNSSEGTKYGNWTSL